jgi:hypothetical protein
MQQKINIIYIGRNAEIRDLVVRLINKNEAWQGLGIETKETLLELPPEQYPELVLMGNGLSADEEESICELLITKYPGTKVIQHYGGGSGLLTGEIMEALSRKATS